MKGIILAGGKGTRLYPITKAISKQLLPVYNKPMIYYPINTLLEIGIKDILIITTPEDQVYFKNLLIDNKDFKVNFEFKIQKKPNGIAESFIIAEDFIEEDPIALILGDNIFYGIDFKKQLELVVERTLAGKMATIFGYSVKNPKRYGVIEFDDEGLPISIEEKPVKPKSNNAVVGLYFYPNEVVKVAKQISPSKRGELEITSLNQYFLSNGQLKVEKFQRGFTWLDTGTHKSLLGAGQFISTIEKRQGIKIGCLEEIAYDKGFIGKDQLIKNVEEMKETTYGKYLIKRYSL